MSTGDDSWGHRWNIIPKSLQCYALGEIKFRFITYNILAGILLRDLFPDPDVLCRYLDCTQEIAVKWFLEFLLLSLEGMEYHQGDEEIAQTMEEMVQPIRFRDENGKLYLLLISDYGPSCWVPGPPLPTEVAGTCSSADNGCLYR